MLELLKDHDLTIRCCFEKLNVVIDALSRKFSGDIATLIISQKFILEELERSRIEVWLQNFGCWLATLIVQPIVIKKIKASYKEDLDLARIRV